MLQGKKTPIKKFILAFAMMGFGSGIGIAQAEEGLNMIPPQCQPGCVWIRYACFCNGTKLTGLTSEDRERSIGAVTLPSGEHIAL